MSRQRWSPSVIQLVQHRPMAFCVYLSASVRALFCLEGGWAKHLKLAISTEVTWLMPWSSSLFFSTGSWLPWKYLAHNSEEDTRADMEMYWYTHKENCSYNLDRRKHQKYNCLRQYTTFHYPRPPPTHTHSNILLST